MGAKGWCCHGAGHGKRWKRPQVSRISPPTTYKERGMKWLTDPLRKQRGRRKQRDVCRGIWCVRHNEQVSE